MTASTELVDEERPIRQADIFRSLSENSPVVGVVVTADCDLANSKAWGIATWIPIVTLDSFVTSKHLWDELEARTSALREMLSKAIAGRRASVGLPEMTSELLAEQLDSLESLDGLCGSASTDDLNRDLSLLRKCAETVRVEPDRTRSWSNEEIARITKLCFRSGRALQRHEAKIIDTIRSKVVSGSGDTFYVHGLDGHDYVALLRFLREMKVAKIAPTAGVARTQGLEFYRFAALKSPYRYELTRRLGAVFSDIGLPAAYSDLGKATAKRTAERLSELCEEESDES